MLRAVALWASTSLVLACGSRDGQSGADPVRASGQRRLIDIPMSGRDPDGSMTYVVAGRVTPSGNHVVLLDAQPPFIKVFRRSGELRSAFLPRGGGPVESRGLLAIAVSGDSLVLTVDIKGRLRTFDLDGRLRQHIPNFPIPVIAATSACDGEWLMYGPRRTPAGTVQWLHRLAIGSGTDAVVSMVEAPPAGDGVWPAPADGMAVTRDGAVVGHNAGGAPAVIRHACGASEGLLAETERSPEKGMVPRRSGNAMMTSVGPGARMRGGIAVAGSRIVVSELVNADGGDGEHSDFHVVGTRLPGRRVPGHVVLLDSRPGTGVLLRTDEEDGRVFLLSERDFLSLVEEPGM